MAIDGIGRPPIPGAPTSVAGEIPRATSRSEFQIKPAAESGATSSTLPVGNSLVNQLHAGQLTQDQYLDIRAEEAVRHLVGKVSTEQIDLIRATLRERLSTDPLLINMIRRATSTLSQR